MLVDQLPTLSDPNGEEEIPIERGTNLYKIKVKNLPTRDVVVDLDLDEESTNPVQNKAIYDYLHNKLTPYNPVMKTQEMTKDVGRDEQGKLYVEPIPEEEIEAAVDEWLKTHTIKGVVFTVHDKNLKLTSMEEGG